MASFERDFSDKTEFPGVEGNRFDVILHAADLISKIPSPVFAILLFAIAVPPTLGRWTLTFGLWAFFLLDWLLLALLPRLSLSYGPPKPPVVVLSLLRAIVAFIPLPLPWIGLPQLLGTVLVLYGFYVEPHNIQITRQRLHSNKLKPSTRLRLLHLGDLHIERITRRERRMLQLAKQMKPDLIVFSGDILNLSYRRDPQAIQEARQVLSQLEAPLGVYAVSGSPAVDLEEVIPELLKDLPLRWLQDERVTLSAGEDQLNLLGVSCTHRPFIDGPRLAELANHQNLRNFTLLLYHTPDLAPVAAQYDIDLQLSGHTHGGQVRLPFLGALFTGSLYGKRYEAGRYRHGQMTLYITRGIGMEGAGAPRVRFLCPPEIVLWEIAGQE